MFLFLTKVPFAATPETQVATEELETLVARHLMYDRLVQLPNIPVHALVAVMAVARIPGAVVRLVHPLNIL
jgi:hypothetical protein